MRRVLIITTGGTIASVESPDGLVPGITSEQLRAYLPYIGSEIHIDIQSLFHIDSTDMTADHWMLIVKAIRENYEEYDGFVVCHGTDTMAYTAAILSYMIQDSEKPVVLTGAQRPIGFEITDAKSNLQDSILYAADPRSRGIQIVFAGNVIAGTRARKVRSMSYAAFASINLPEIAEIRNGRIIRYLSDRIEKLQPPDNSANWVDLRAAEDVDLKKGDFRLIRLGVAMKLPEGYEAHIVPRSSTYKNFGIIQANHYGVIDNAYSGDGDEWMVPVIAMRDTSIHINDRICQFRIEKRQPDIFFEEVDHLDDTDRGGFGSTGIQ